MITYNEFSINPNGPVEQRFLCPVCSKFHGSKNKTVSFNIVKGCGVCFRCGWNGKIDSTAYTIPTEKPKTTFDRHRNLKRTLSASENVKPKTPVYRYLSHRLGCDLVSIPKCLRYIPSLNYYDDDRKLVGAFPAMLAIISNPKGEPVSLHRTYLTSDGKKANVPTPKKLMSPIRNGAMRGGAIRLFEATNQIAIAEGIETALAVYVATGIPAWSTVSASMMKSLVVPSKTETILIFADNDENQTGQNAANFLANRLCKKGHSVKVMIPDSVGDWLNIWEAK